MYRLAGTDIHDLDGTDRLGCVDNRTEGGTTVSHTDKIQNKLRGSLLTVFVPILTLRVTSCEVETTEKGGFGSL